MKFPTACFLALASLATSVSNSALAEEITLSPSMKLETTHLLKCVRKRIQKKHLALGNEDLLEKARILITSNDEDGMSDLVSECKDYRSAPDQILSISQETKAVIDAFTHVKSLSCHGVDLRVRAALGVGAAAGLQTEVCEFTDGTRRLYFGPDLGFVGWAIGASVTVREIQSDQKATKLGTLYTFSNDGAHGDGVGLFIGDTYTLTGMIKLWKKKDRLDPLIATLTEGVVINAPQDDDSDAHE